MRTNRIFLDMILGLMLIGMLSFTACENLPGEDALKIVSHSGYTTGDSLKRYLIVVGEVQNTGSNNLRNVKIMATFYDEDGKVQSTSEADTMLDILLPGEKSPFAIYSYRIEGMKKYSLKVIDYEKTDIQPSREFQVVDYTSDIHRIFGTYQNTGTSVAGSPEVIATCYDVEGRVIGAGSDWQAVTQLKTGEATPFDVEVWPVDCEPKSATCILQIQCESSVQ